MAEENPSATTLENSITAHTAQDQVLSIEPILLDIPLTIFSSIILFFVASPYSQRI